MEKNDLRCDLCKGIGIVKNTSLYCDFCDAARCKYTLNLCKDEFYKYKYCELCVDFDLKEKKNCHKCLGSGYYLNKGVVCNGCEIPHRVCNCVVKLFDECTKCFGSGKIN